MWHWANNLHAGTARGRNKAINGRDKRKQPSPNAGGPGQEGEALNCKVQEKAGGTVSEMCHESQKLL